MEAVILFSYNLGTCSELHHIHSFQNVSQHSSRLSFLASSLECQIKILKTYLNQCHKEAITCKNINYINK